MTSTPMVETIARAIRSGRGCEGDVPCHFCEWGPDERTSEHDETGCMWLARAALSALSTPTEGMVEAGAKEDEPELWAPAPGHNQGECVYCDDRRQAKLFEAKQRFVAMIQAALSEGEA